MPFDITCTSCSRLLRVPDEGAGKHVKCPQCQTVLLAPQANGQAATGSPSTVEMWSMKGADGQTYGPVPRSELDNWCREGRLASSSQILRQGSAQWQYATDLYPHLAQTAPVGGSSHSGYQRPASAGANPFVGVGAKSNYGGSPYAPAGYTAPSTYSPYQGQQNMSDKSRVAAGILGIFLGAYGIHRFYLGDAGMGVAQLVVTICTCGIGGIWGFIEGIMILSGAIDRDAYGRKLRD